MSINFQDFKLTRGKNAAESFTLDIPSLIIPQGEKWFLKGGSGSGKTSLLFAIAGMLTPTSGSVTVLGQALETLSEVKRDRFRGENIGLIFQNHQLFQELNVLENLLAGIRYATGKPANALQKEKAEALLNEVGLFAKKDSNPSELSLGQQQRVAVVRSILNEPKIILADEPTASLDSLNKTQVLDLILSYVDASQATLIMATHDDQLSIGENSNTLNL